jgi:outer membrane protein assembly factor BamB/tetratricopeptide (TPR) repeat protein
MTSLRPRRAFFAFPGLAFPWGVLLVAVVGWCQGRSAVAQEPAPGRAGTTFYADFSDTADALLRNAASHVHDGQWAEAVEIYQRVIQQYGDKVARIPKGDPGGDPASESQLYVDVRQFCQRKLAALPPPARAIYRARVDGQAERWYRQGESLRDRALLRRVVEQAFCSSWGDDASELLGDLAFQDGRFEEALASYRRLVPDRAGEGAGLVHPDPSVDLARVAAKMLLSRAAQGDLPPTASDLETYAKTYPNASGTLAGQEGAYLATLVRALGTDRLAPPAQPDGRWPTFAGSPTRTRVVPGPIDVGSIQWHVDLEPVATSRGPHGYRGITTTPGPTAPGQKLAYHPIVLGDQVIVCDENRITAYNLNDRPETPPGAGSGTVKPAWQHSSDDGNGPQATRMTLGLPRFTLTAHGDRIFARMGLNSFSSMGRMGATSSSYLVAVDRGTEGKLLWKKPSVDVLAALKPAEGASRSIGFEGTPVADSRNVYVALTERREQTATYIACLDAETGATRWVRYLGAAASDNENPFGFGMGMGMGGGSQGDYGHRLLTLDGPTIYYQTNLGAVVALDAETGSVRWVATYPRLDRNGTRHDRDLNPAVVHDGLVIVAPDDAASIYAFDAAHGRLAWKTDPLPDEVKLSHVLGVAKGRLIATGDRVLIFDVKTGKLVHTWPDSGQGYEGYGRGVLAGDKIYWPTRTEIHVLDQASGLRSDPPIKLMESFQTTGGNLAVGDGYLVVAQAEQLVVFCQNRRLIQRYREEIARSPEQASYYVRMARAAEATGQDDLALDSLARALEKTKPSETIDGAPLGDTVRDQRFRLLVKMGDKARTAGDLAGAELRFHAAAETARNDRDRLRARLDESQAQLDRGEAAAAVVTLQSLLAEDRLRSLTVAAEESRRSIRSDLLIGERLASILKAHGRKVYARFDREAADLLGRGKTAGDPRLLEEVARSYPVSEAVADSLLALGRLHAGQKRPGEAARSYKRLLAAAPTDAGRARALLGLARAYEAQKLWVPARDTYTQALTRFAAINVDDEALATEAPLGPLVARRLEQPPFDRMMADRAEPSLPLPLVRRWSKTIDGPVRPVTADGTPPSPEASRVFLAKGNTIRPAPAGASDAPWTAGLDGPVGWVGYLDDRVLAATATKIVALDLRRGERLWAYDASAPAAARRAADPFAKPDAAPAAAPPPETAGPLQGFRIVGGRLFFLRGDRELIALDGDTGLVDWSFTPTGGTINTHLWVGPERAVLQTRPSGALLVLDTATGRRRSEFGLDQEEWARDPLPLDDDRVVLVVDRRTVALFDLARGVNAWVFRESRELPKNGPPRLLGDAERLLMVNDGNELIRLDAATGTKRWSRPLGTEDLSERPDALALDGARVYWVSGQSLRAAALGDGTLVWSQHLSGPEAGWSVDLTERFVLAYPGLPRRAGEELEGLSLVFRRRENGALAQRLFFPITVTDVSVRLLSGGAVVATQSGVWSLGGRGPVDGRGAGR